MKKRPSDSAFWKARNTLCRHLMNNVSGRLSGRYIESAWPFGFEGLRVAVSIILTFVLICTPGLVFAETSAQSHNESMSALVFDEDSQDDIEEASFNPETIVSVEPEPSATDEDALAVPEESETGAMIEASADMSGQTVTAGTDCVMSSDTYENSVTAANMVLLVSFSDTSQNMLDAFNKSYYIADNILGIKTNWQNFMWSVDGIKQTYVQRTWRDYLYEISQGQCNVKSYFPQTQADGKVVHITLDRPASDYKDNDGLLVGDVASKFNAQLGSYNASRTDKNGDGFIDNLMIVPTSSGVFTSHKGSLGEVVTFGSGNNARKVKESITVVEGPLELSSGGMPNSGFSESVAVHEYLHTLGARDYYRDGISGDPVSYWDVMAKGGAYSWPLAFTRESVGWTNIPEVDSKNLKDSYTLYAPSQSDAKKGVSNPSKPQALKIKTSLSSSEYFIVEYRQKNGGSTGSLAYDRYIGASGLIVYRVNESHSTMGNIRGDDYVYVFRPGETGLKDSAGDVDRAAIAAGSYVSQNGKTLNTSIGSTDLNAKFTDNTIFFENGLNSGIKIDAVSQTDGSITFKISTADYAQADMWEPLTNKDGSTPFGSWTSPSVEATNDGSSPYLLAGNSSYTNPLWAVWKHDGSNWQQIGQKQSDMRSAHLVVMDGKPYLLGVSMSNKKQIVIKALTSNQWQTHASATLNGEVWSTDLRAIGGKLYAFAGANGDCRMFTLEGSTLKQYGPTLPVASSYAVSIADCGGNPLIIANDQGGTKTNAYRLNGSSWSVTQIKSSASSVIDSVTKDGKTYVYAFTYNGTSNDARLSVLSSNAAVERSYVLPDLQDATSDTSLSAGKNNLYFVKSTSEGVKAYSLPYGAANAGDVSQSKQLGGTVFSSASSMDVVAVGDSAYCMLGDANSSSIAVRYHKLQTGDIAEPLDPSQGGSSEPTVTSIANATVQVAAQTYTGKPLTPKPTVKIGSVTLKEGTDYILEYRNNTNVGYATVLVKGKGNYTGTKSATFKINAAPAGKSIASATVTTSQMIRNANGNAIVPSITVKYGSITLKNGTDYSVEYYLNGKGSPVSPKAAGSYTIKVKGKGNYSGETIAKDTFKLVQGPSVSSSTQVKIAPIANLNYVLDAVANPPKIGANVSIWNDNGGNNQKWYLELGNDGYYTIKSAANKSFIIDAAANPPKVGSNVSIWTTKNQNNQKWVIEPSTNGSYIIRNAANPSLVLDAAGVSPKCGANVSVWSAKSQNNNNQKWKIVTVNAPSFDANKTYEISSVSNSSFVLDAAANPPKIGANVSIWTKKNQANQKWYIQKDSQGYYTIRSAANKSFILDAAANPPRAGSNVSIWTSKNQANQKWIIEQLANGSYIIKSVGNSKLVLDATGATPKIGANVSVWTANGGNNQKWNIKPV